VVLYLVPRTAPLGALLLTAYLGGATAIQVRVEDPWFLFPIAIGLCAWAGLLLRDSRLFGALSRTGTPLTRAEAENSGFRIQKKTEPKARPRVVSPVLNSEF
jgi:hypothetical protein